MRIHTDGNGVYANAITNLSDGTDVAGHHYQIQAGICGVTLLFQNGAVKEHGVNGLTSEALLAVLIHRTEVLNARFPCEENFRALEHLKGALGELNLRTARRTERGVEGREVA